MWIERDISRILSHSRDLIQIIRGPRQCGKSSLMLRLDADFTEVSLDDPALRDLAQRDPELFLSQFQSQRLFIDEAQYAPALFPSLKRRVDLYKRSTPRGPQKTLYRLTGSNQLLMDRNVKESLAGRASFFDMNTLSVSEILAARDLSIQEILYLGGWPELHAQEAHDSKKYLDDYIHGYIEKDIVLAAGVQKRREFLTFVRLLAGRVGELLDLSSLGRDAGIDSKTVKEWASILESMHVIALVPPYASNLSTRLMKSPKIYFIDTGLACRLQGWTSAAPILSSPQQGHLFENLVFSEIFKLNLNEQLGWQIFHWRSRAGEEVDFLIDRGSAHTPLLIEAKVSRPSTNIDLKGYPELNKVFKKIPPLICCHQEGSRALGQNVPLAHLKSYLLAL